VFLKQLVLKTTQKISKINLKSFFSVTSLEKVLMKAKTSVNETARQRLASMEKIKLNTQYEQ